MRSNVSTSPASQRRCCCIPLPCLHHLSHVAHPRSRMLAVMQRDVTEQVLMEGMMSELMQAQLTMLCQIFPRWGP